MNVSEAIKLRRAYRSLEPVDITKDLVEDLARHAGLAPSCFNHQPWRFVFVYEKSQLEKMHTVLSKGNEWATKASLIIAVFSKEEDDCIIRDRIYHQFDCGLGAGFLILRATEMGLVAHPIAGFSPKKTRKVLGIPDEFKVITLIMVGKKADTIDPILSDKQASWEKRRPRRKSFSHVAYLNRFGK